MSKKEIEEILEKAKDKVTSLSDEEKEKLINEHYGKWTMSKGTVIEILEKAIGNIDLDLKSINFNTFKKNHAQTVAELGYLRMSLDNFEKEDKKQLLQKIQNILESITHLENSMYFIFSLQNNMLDGEAEITLSSSNNLLAFQKEDFSKNTHLQNLLVYLAHQLKIDKYRRSNGECYKREPTEKGHDSHTWKMVCTLEEYIHSKTMMVSTKFDMWQNLTHGSGNMKAAVEYLSTCQDLFFTDIVKNRHVFAFENGIYFACPDIDKIDRTSNNYSKEFGSYKDMFIPFEGPKAIHIPNSVTASKYFKAHLDETIFEKIFEDAFETTEEKKEKERDNDKDTEDVGGAEKEEYDPFDIIKKSCKAFAHIMNYQEWPEDVQRWLCIFIGRCLYDVGQLDNWQVIPFMYGQAGTGKSTIINYIVKLFYEDADVSVLSNNMQKTFGLDTIADKKLFVAPEVKESFNLEQSEFQSMVSGEAMSLSIKFKNPKNIPRWKVPGFMAGNEVPGYKDTAGSIPRRMAVFMFNKRIKKEDGNTMLPQELKRELPQIMVACNKLYLQEVERNGTKDIWSILPQYFAESRDTIAGATNALISFFRSGKVVLGENYCCSDTKLSEEFKNYCVAINAHGIRWGQQYCMGPFSEYGIKTLNSHRVIDPNDNIEYRGIFHQGIDLANTGRMHIDKYGNILDKDGNVAKDDGKEIIEAFVPVDTEKEFS